jgi:putative hemolysin
MLGMDTTETKAFMTEEELKSLINVSHEEGILKVEDRKIILNVFDFKNLHADDIMIHRTDITAISVNTDYNDINKIFQETCYSRIPVYEDNIDNIVGILYFKDFIYAPADFNLLNIIQKPFFTHKLKNIKELFHEMRNNSVHIAIILDAHGGTEGIVTLEDLIEEIVGKISDEHDENEEDIKQINDKEYIVKGSVKLEDINEVLGLNLQSNQFSSIGGYIIDIIESIPEKGKIIDYENMRCIVEEVQDNKIDKIRVILHPPPQVRSE